MAAVVAVVSREKSSVLEVDDSRCLLPDAYTAHPLVLGGTCLLSTCHGYLLLTGSA